MTVKRYRLTEEQRLEAQADVDLALKYLDTAIKQHRRAIRWGIAFDAFDAFNRDTPLDERLADVPDPQTFDGVTPLSTDERQYAYAAAHQIGEIREALLVIRIVASHHRRGLPPDIASIVSECGRMNAVGGEAQDGD